MLTFTVPNDKYKRGLIIVGSLGLCAVCLWTAYRYKQKQSATQYIIKNLEHCKYLIPDTQKLLHSEWKNKDLPQFDVDTEDTKDDDEKKERVETIPCHRILICIAPKSIFDLNTMNDIRVIGHVNLTEPHRDVTIAKLSKMLKMGISEEAIKQRVETSALDIDLNDDIFRDNDGKLTFDNVDQDIDKGLIREIYIGSLIIHKSFRRKGFAKLLLSESVLFVNGLGYKKLCGTASKKLIEFYQHLGGVKEMKQKTYKMNEISVPISDEMIENCNNELLYNKRGYKITTIPTTV